MRCNGYLQTSTGLNLQGMGDLRLYVKQGEKSSWWLSVTPQTLHPAPALMNPRRVGLEEVFSVTQACENVSSQTRPRNFGICLPQL